MRSVPDLMSQLLTIDLEAKDLMYRFLVNLNSTSVSVQKTPGSFFGHEALQRGRQWKGPTQLDHQLRACRTVRSAWLRALQLGVSQGSSENFRLNRECSFLVSNLCVEKKSHFSFAEVLDLTLKVVERWFDLETFTEFPFDAET